jgi:hypothetical protein
MKMNLTGFVFLFLAAFMTAPMAPCQEVPTIEGAYPILSPFYNVPGSTDERFKHLNFRFGWTHTAPYRIAVQISNPTYGEQKIKFAIRDLTTNQTLLLDEEHNAYAINEALPAGMNGQIWSGDIQSLSDAFALKVWDGDGDSFQQTPVTISNAWTKKRPPARKLNSPTPTPAAQVVPTINKAAHPGGTPVQTPTPTVILTATLTDTPTPCQTPAPYLKCALAFFGDSWTGDNDPSNPLQKYFCNLTYRGLAKWYPGLVSTRDDLVEGLGCAPECWNQSLSGYLDLMVKKNQGVPIGYMVFQTGNVCFYYAPDPPAHTGCKGTSVSQGVSISYLYQKHMDEILGTIYAKLPDVHLVVLGIADTTGGAGHYAPPEVYQAYRDRLWELKAKYPQMRIVDLYPAVGDHTEFYYRSGGREHPSMAGHAFYAKCILDQFSYWPYRPEKH